MEMGETVEDAAKREAQEEACADLELERVLAVYSIPRISQVQVMFKARLLNPDVAPGPESQEVKLVKWDDIPWAGMAFPSAIWALKNWKSVEGRTDYVPFSNPPDSEHLTR